MTVFHNLVVNSLILFENIVKYCKKKQNKKTPGIEHKLIET